MRKISTSFLINNLNINLNSLKKLRSIMLHREQNLRKTLIRSIKFWLNKKETAMFYNMKYGKLLNLMSSTIQIITISWLRIRQLKFLNLLLIELNHITLKDSLSNKKTLLCLKDRCNFANRSKPSNKKNRKIKCMLCNLNIKEELKYSLIGIKRDNWEVLPRITRWHRLNKLLTPKQNGLILITRRTWNILTKVIWNCDIFY